MEFETERPHALKIAHETLAGMTTEDVRWLLAWAIIKQATFPHFTAWMHMTLTAELNHRSDELVERAMPTIPRLTAMELSDFMQASYVLCRLPLSDGQAKFADRVSLLVMADVSAALEQFEIGTIVT